MTYTSSEIIDLEDKYGAHNYHPLPVVISKAEGCKVWDPEGREYFDFLAAYSAVNQGHLHPKIIQALIDQASKVTVCSRAFHSDKLGPFEKMVSDLFGYEMMLPMNTGAEAVETALKLARRWGYDKKGIPENEAIVLACSNNFHGRTIAIIGMSTDPDCRVGFGPFPAGLGPVCPSTSCIIKYNCVDDLEAALEAHGPKVAGFLVEPIQGEAGVLIPDRGYLKACHDLCKKHNVLFIADEIQSGLGRAGKLLAVHHEGIRPDMVILGKALSGGVLPVSAVLADKEIMLCIKPGQHGSTYGGNPLACAVGMAALQVLIDEELCDKSERLGKAFRSALLALNHPLLTMIRGEGLMNAIEIDGSKAKGSAWDLCCVFRENGLITKPTHDTIIRLTPPLCITESQLMECVQIIKPTLLNNALKIIAQLQGHCLLAQKTVLHMDHYALRQWLDHWRQCVELSEDDISQSMYTELVEPFRKGDPVFSSSVARELTFTPYSEQISRILSVPSHSTKRVLICEILFNICKCTNHECRVFVASQLPVLLWTEWALDREALGLEEDLSAIEVALLAAFQQDLNIEASVPQIRIPDITKKSIYHDPASDTSPEKFPYKTGKEHIIKPDPSMYPTRPVTKIDEYSRVIVLYRLSRLMLDNLPSLPVSSKIAFCFLIERLATIGTRMTSVESVECLRKIMKNAIPDMTAQDNQSMMSLLQFELQESNLLERNPVHVTEDSSSAGLIAENTDFEWLLDLFGGSCDAQNRRFPASSPLYLLWADVLAAISFQFPGFVKIMRKQLLRRARPVAKKIMGNNF